MKTIGIVVAVVIVAVGIYLYYTYTYNPAVNPPSIGPNPQPTGDASEFPILQMS